MFLIGIVFFEDELGILYCYRRKNIFVWVNCMFINLEYKLNGE